MTKASAEDSCIRSDQFATDSQRSGIGPGDVLQAAGVPVIAERRAVGENLQDRLEVYFQVACLRQMRSTNILGWSQAMIGAQWLFFKSGLGAQINSRLGHQVACRRRYPDIQYHFLPVAISYDGTAPATGHEQCVSGPMRSKSRGYGDKR